MPCDKVDLGDGAFAIACSRGGRTPPCATPGCGGRGQFLCDYPLAGKRTGKTCDRAMCARCRVSMGPERDFCASHVALAKEQTP
jgi:hypothetical protein